MKAITNDFKEECVFVGVEAINGANDEDVRGEPLVATDFFAPEAFEMFLKPMADSPKNGKFVRHMYANLLTC
jgi:hypothetical protein